MSTSGPVSRMKYFSGEALLKNDFQAEQDYHRGMRERVNEGVFCPGIVQGLDVTWEISNPNQVKVSTGMAIDKDGHQIVQTDDATVGPDILKLVPSELGYLTIEYHEVPGLPMGEAAAAEPKRWNEIPKFTCSDDPPSDGSKVLLAIIKADSNGAIGSVYYHHLGFGRTHVGARLGSVRFEPEVLPPLPFSSSMSISAEVDMETNEPRLEISAPTIRLDGKVELTDNQLDGQFSGNFNGTGSLNGSFTGTGTFSGTFSGDGSGLTNLPSVDPHAVNYWTQDGSNLYYMLGNVGIGASNPTARLTVDGGSGQQIGSGIVTLDAAEQTLHGSQTSFTTELDKGDLLTFGSVQEQDAAIYSVDLNNKLTLSGTFKLSVGWCPVVSRSAGGGTKQGSGRFLAEGTAVTGDKDTKFLSELENGDSLVIASFVPKQSIGLWSVAETPTSDTEVKVSPVSPNNGTGEYPIGSVFAVSKSGSGYALQATGGAQIDTLTVTGSLTVGQAKITENSMQFLGMSQELSQIESSSSLLGQTLQSSEPSPSDGLVTIAAVALSSEGQAQHSFGYLTTSTQSWGLIQACTSPTGAAPYTSFGRVTLTPYQTPDNTYALAEGAITLPLKKGDYIVYSWWVYPQGAPNDFGIDVSTALFAHQPWKPSMVAPS